MEQKKHRKHILFAVGILLILLGGFLLVMQTEFGRHMIGYTGPHLRCTLTMTVDGRNYTPDEAAISALNLSSGEENTVSHFRQCGSGCGFRCKDGDYGGQPFQITVQDAEMQTLCMIPVTVTVSDNWRMTELELTVSINTNDGTYTYDAQADISGDRCFSSDTLTFDGTRGIRISNI